MRIWGKEISNCLLFLIGGGCKVSWTDGSLLIQPLTGGKGFKKYHSKENEAAALTSDFQEEKGSRMLD